MGKRVKLCEAAELTGLTEYSLRLGIRQGRYPHIRTGGNSGKILIDIELLERYLEQEATQNASGGIPTANSVNYEIGRAHV